MAAVAVALAVLMADACMMQRRAGNSGRADPVIAPSPDYPFISLDRATLLAPVFMPQKGAIS